MKCPKCKIENPDDSQYCRKCATPLTEIPATLTSPPPEKEEATKKSALDFAPGEYFGKRYQIIEEIGRGGMGRVYKALDKELNRTVALKMIKPEISSHPGIVERFKKEIKLASQITHDNVCRIHDLGEVKGIKYISMQFIEGNNLHELIQTSKGLKVETAINITEQICQALTAAHKKGVIHRDLKPQNIMIDKKGTAYVMDFGIARSLEEEEVTKPGTIIGTPHYMSPEQAEGKGADKMSDIYSLGCIMYEMLTGKPPFEADTSVALLHKHLKETPKPPSQLNPQIPPSLGKIILKCMEKDRARRYQNINELLQDLKKPPPAVIKLPKAEKSIVVLPFEDISPGRDNEYFSDGLTEEIITDLSKVHSLRVISRSSAMTFKGTKKKIKEIARDVNVQYVLEGSVRKAGNNLRITAQLIDAAGDKYLWAEKYKGTLDDVFDIQEKVSLSIVDELKLKLSPEENKKIAERPIDNVQAYECYLRARQEIWRWTEDAFDRALQYLKNGLNIVGENSLLYAGMGYVYWNYVNLGGKQEDYIEKAEECVKKAFELDPDSPKGHLVLGVINQSIKGDQLESIRHLKRALAVDPDDPDVLFWLAIGYTMCIGKTFAAGPLVERLLLIDPFNPNSHWLPGLVLFFEGRYDLALEQLRKAYQMESENPVFQFFYSLVLVHNKYLKEAYDIIDQSEKETPEHGFIQLTIFLKYALQGKKTAALKALSKELQIWARRDPAYSMLISEGYALISEKEEALNWLENAVNRGNINYPFLSEYDPFLENIRGKERFKKLMERVKHEWEHFEV